MKNKKNLDLPDTEKDKRQLKAENFEIEIPDVKDIPGQENIHIPPPGEMADTTISSADEEGSGILDNPEEQDEITNQLNANVTKDERKVLDDASKKITS